MRRDPTIPVYLITGFLDSGKSNFLKYTLSQDYFNDRSRTLLLLTEEGEEEYDEKLLKSTNTKLLLLEDESELNKERLQEISATYKPDRVLIEYNGMWSVKNMLDLELPKYWMYYQIITILDGASFKLYLNNIKMQSMELLTYTDMVVFNRCDSEEDMVLYQRTVRSVNRKCDLVFENTNGEEVECPEPDLPYDIDGSDIEISDENYGTFYIDLSEHHERYEGKTIHFLMHVMQDKKFPADVFVAGRRAMTCCEADIRFLPYMFKYEKAKSLENRSWANISAVCRWEFSEAYKEDGPVFYVKELKLANRPADELVYF